MSEFCYKIVASDRVKYVCVEAETQKLADASAGVFSGEGQIERIEKKDLPSSVKFRRSQKSPQHGRARVIPQNHARYAVKKRGCCPLERTSVSPHGLSSTTMSASVINAPIRVALTLPVPPSEHTAQIPTLG